MFLSLLVGHGHLLIMFAVTIFLILERLEPPTAPEWGWHGPRSCARTVMAQLRRGLAARADASWENRT
jgi:hypothetical protein